MLKWIIAAISVLELVNFHFPNLIHFKMFCATLWVMTYSPLQPLSHRRNTGILSLIYRYFDVKCSDELHFFQFHQFRPLQLENTMLHPRSWIALISLVFQKRKFHFSFFPKNCYFVEQNCFVDTYKSITNRYLSSLSS